jgi:hypothetical protein
MQHKKFVACAAAALMAVALGCSDDSSTPVSPTGATAGPSGAGPAGETLKATAPSPQSPINNQQPDSLVLVSGKSSPSYAVGTPPAYSYEFEVRNSAGSAAVCPSILVPGGSGSSVSATPNCNLEFDQPYTWRVRAAFAGANGPWSANATFRAPAGGYIRGNEIYDPLTTGRTVGNISGPTQFLSGQGLQLQDHSSFVTYELPTNLQEGEMSMMILNADEGNPGDKSKLFSMQEGPDLNDITTDDYRCTIELRGRNYGDPGSVTFRIIPGDGEPQDAHRSSYSFNSSTWYFWRFEWRTGFARLEVREGGPNGRLMIDKSVGGWDHPYRPLPHFVHLGAPQGRAGALDATMPGIIIKNLWVSSRPRPAFPGE